MNMAAAHGCGLQEQAETAIGTAGRRIGGGWGAFLEFSHQSCLKFGAH